MKLPRLLTFFLLTSLLLILPISTRAQDAGGAYIVVSGDTLLAISERHDVSLTALMAANNIKNPSLIYPGQRLVIPNRSPASAGAASPPAMVYTRKTGDTLFSIARRFQVDPTRILILNGFRRPQDILLEDSLLIPITRLPAPFREISTSGPIVQGQTGIIVVATTQATPPTGAWGSLPLRFWPRGGALGGYRYWALLPTSALATSGAQTLTLRADGQELTRSVPILAGTYDTQPIVLPPAKDDLLEPTRVRSEFERLYKIWTTVSDKALWRGRFRFPIGEGFVQTSPYGTRRSYNGGPASSFHEGSDWSAAEGTPVVAPASGVVVLAENLDVRGGAVVIDHGLGVTSNVWHLSRIDVEPGQRVAPGDAIGLVGTTGLSTGAHLHWEIRVHGVAVDPMQWTREALPFVPLTDAS